ncbi:formate dehydrogenase [Dorcoceras hygrometricum]|uniref:Formate dehydrogenase n=1 Tax=Dorcoceras hygrometricum TaxID=472368 RepID=A0A2Z7AXH5_9LAMI|nr:formate dehydrogenase [Dorcoceras hygrometricum]
MHISLVNICYLVCNSPNNDPLSDTAEMGNETQLGEMLGTTYFHSRVRATVYLKMMPNSTDSCIIHKNYKYAKI